MLLRFLVLGLVMSSQSGCAAAGYVAYKSAKQQSAKMASGVMATERPDLPSTKAGQCVVKGMTIPEIMTFGGGNDVQPTARHVTATQSVIQRQNVAACLAALKKPMVKA